MDTKSLVLVLVPSFLSILLAASNIAFYYFRDKKRREERVWDTAERITLAAHAKGGENNNDRHTADDLVVFFNRVYLLLWEVEDGSFVELQESSELYQAELEPKLLLPLRHCDRRHR